MISGDEKIKKKKYKKQKTKNKNRNNKQTTKNRQQPTTKYLAFFFFSFFFFFIFFFFFFLLLLVVFLFFFVFCSVHHTVTFTDLWQAVLYSWGLPFCLKSGSRHRAANALPQNCWKALCYNTSCKPPDGSIWWHLRSWLIFISAYKLVRYHNPHKQPTLVNTVDNHLLQVCVRWYYESGSVSFDAVSDALKPLNHRTAKDFQWSISSASCRNPLSDFRTPRGQVSYMQRSCMSYFQLGLKVTNLQSQRLSSSFRNSPRKCCRRFEGSSKNALESGIWG